MREIKKQIESKKGDKGEKHMYGRKPSLKNNSAMKFHLNYKYIE